MMATQTWTLGKIARVRFFHQSHAYHLLSAEVTGLEPLVLYFVSMTGRFRPCAQAG